MSTEKTTALIKNPQEELIKRLDVVNTMLDELSFEDKSYSVGGEFMWSPNYNGPGTYIPQATLDECEEIAGFLIGKQEKIETGRSFLGTDKVKRPVPKWLSIPIDNWLADCKLRVNIILHQDRKERLSAIKRQLKARLSEETQISQLISNFDDEFGFNE